MKKMVYFRILAVIVSFLFLGYSNGICFDKVEFNLKNSTIGNFENEFINWYFGEDNKDVTVFTDCELKLVDQSPSRYKVAWVVESPEYLHSDIYKFIRKNERKFDIIFSCYRKFIEQGKPYAFCPVGNSWIDLKDRQVYKKSRNLSIIASAKNFLTGHKLRHQIIKKYRDQIEGIYGGGYNPVDNKLAGLKEYRYSLVIENCREDYYFTEKLIDCFVTGTVPIYWGCPSIGNFFDLDGIITFNSIEELNSILPHLSKEDYFRRMKAIEGNFEKAKLFYRPERFLRAGIEEYIKNPDSKTLFVQPQNFFYHMKSLFTRSKND